MRVCWLMCLIFRLEIVACLDKSFQLGTVLLHHACNALIELFAAQMLSVQAINQNREAEWAGTFKLYDVEFLLSDPVEGLSHPTFFQLKV